ncbi:MAG: hypothetical protein GY899_09730 [Verrucomicrobiaceae bacterium]|nr:hypothetical protein [Verrucomicrobiaceae bacterium]
MHLEEPKIILERKAGRELLGCGMAACVIAYGIVFLFRPEAASAMAVVSGICIACCLLSMRHDFSSKRNIILTVHGIKFSAGRFMYRQMEILWTDLGEVNFRRVVGTRASVSCILLLSKKGISDTDNNYIISYCGNLGRQVKHSSLTLDAEDAARLIEELRDAGSLEARSELITSIPTGSD